MSPLAIFKKSIRALRIENITNPARPRVRWNWLTARINENADSDNTIYNPNMTQAVWINRSKFGGNSPIGPDPDAG